LAHLIHVYIHYLLFLITSYRLFTHSYDVIPDFRILSRWFSTGSTVKTFGVKKIS